MKNKEIEELLKDEDNYIEEYGFRYKRIALDDWWLLLSYIETLKNRNKELYEGFMATQEELTDYATKNEQLENNRDKALKIIDSYDLGKYDYSIPAGGIIELREVLKGDSDDE